MKVSWSLYSPQPFTHLLEEARLCEAEGLDGVWYPDHEGPASGYLEVHTVLAAVALGTRRLVVGSLVTDVVRRHPVVLAHIYASLSQLAPGRVVLGLGGGGAASYIPYGIRVERPRARLQEGVEVIRLLWSAPPGQGAQYQGEFFTLKGGAAPLAPKRRIPIYLAASGPRMLELVARLGDGWLPENYTPEFYRSALTRLRGLMGGLGRSPKELEACLVAPYYPGEPGDETYHSLLEGAKRYMAAYPEVVRAAGLEHPGHRTLQLAHNPQLWEELARQIPDHLADKTLIYGRLEECVDRAAHFQEAGCQHLILSPYWIEPGLVEEAVRQAGRLRKALQP